MKNPDAKAAVGKEWDKLKTLPAWDVKNAKHKSEEVQQAQKNGRLVSSFHIPHGLSAISSTPSLPNISKQYKEEPRSGEDYVKDDSGYRERFTEQGTSASQVAQAKIMDTICRLAGIMSEASDAGSADSQVHMSGAPTFLHLPWRQRPKVWVKLPPGRRLKQWDSIEEPVVPLERNSYGRSLAGLPWERKLEKGASQGKQGPLPTWQCPCVHRESQLFLSVSVDDTKMDAETSAEQHRPGRADSCAEYSILELHPENSII